MTYPRKGGVCISLLEVDNHNYIYLFYCKMLKTNKCSPCYFPCQVMEFSAEMVATFIAVVGILSVVAQTALLSLLMKKLSNKHVIMVKDFSAF